MLEDVGDDVLITHT